MITDLTLRARFVRRMSEAGMAQHTAGVLVEQVREQVEAMRGDEYEELRPQVELATHLAHASVELSERANKLSEQRLRYEIIGFVIFSTLSVGLVGIWLVRVAQALIG